MFEYHLNKFFTLSFFFHCVTAVSIHALLSFRKTFCHHRRQTYSGKKLYLVCHLSFFSFSTFFLVGTLKVNVSVLLLSLASPDESSLVSEFCLSLTHLRNVLIFALKNPSQKYEVEFLLQQQWVDPRLMYANQSSYEFLNAIHHNDKMWLPDTYFIMHGDFKDNPIIPMHFALRIYRNGTINYLMR